MQSIFKTALVCSILSLQELLRCHQSAGIWAAAERLGLPVPEAKAPTGHWKEDDKIRLCKTLNADVLCGAQIAVAADRKNAKLCFFAISVWLKDINFQFIRTGGYSSVRKKQLRTAITLGVNDAAQQCPARLLPTVHVLSRMGDRVDVDLGVRGGVKVGDEMVVWREIGGRGDRAVVLSINRVLRAVAARPPGLVGGWLQALMPQSVS